jgi:hypothetical protein
MVSSKIALLCHMAAALVTAGLLAGCGSSGHSGSASTQSRSSSTSTLPCGVKGRSCITKAVKAQPGGLAARLASELAKNEARLKAINVRCPRGPVRRYPFTCHFTATDRGEPIPPGTPKTPTVLTLSKPHPVIGTISPYGYNTRTGLYEYSLTYGLKR